MTARPPGVLTSSNRGEPRRPPRQPAPGVEDHQRPAPHPQPRQLRAAGASPVHAFAVAFDGKVVRVVGG